MEDSANLLSLYRVNSSAFNMRNFSVSEKGAVGVQSRLPLTMLQYTDSFEIKLLKWPIGERH